ncbi:MAG: hypothetical protein HKM86_06935 [Deltaproteobacteria bacterium]|nr:hypothetical protein [Deltaproteobacteria bacterium]
MKKLRERRTGLGKKIAVKSAGEVVRAIRLTKNEKQTRRGQWGRDII